MKRIDVYNICLDMLNIEPITESDLAGKVDPVPILERNFGFAVLKASKEHDWTFLTEVVKLGEDLGPEGGYGHSYRLPYGLLRVVHMTGRGVVSGSKLLTDGFPRVYAIMAEKTPKGEFVFEQDDSIPEDFWQLVACQLAMFCAPRLCRDTNVFSMIQYNYKSVLANMIESDSRNCVNFIEQDEENEELYGVDYE